MYEALTRREIDEGNSGNVLRKNDRKAGFGVLVDVTVEEPGAGAVHLPGRPRTGQELQSHGRVANGSN